MILVEEFAQRTYVAASRAFFGEDATSRFLEHQAEDESRHALALHHALAVLDERPPGIDPSAFRTDAETAQSAVGALEQIQRRLAGTNRLSAAELALLVEEAESSEWNDLFVYVMEVLQSLGREFQVAAAEIQEHRDTIDAFVATTIASPELVRLRADRKVWTRTVLVIEDDVAVAKLLEAVFRREFRVVVAANGREALDLLNAGHFDAIISDVEMPVMDGIECFRRALAIDPSIRRRFIFHTTVEGRETFFAETDVPVLSKPSPLSEIQHRVRQVIQHARDAGHPQDK